MRSRSDARSPSTTDIEARGAAQAARAVIERLAERWPRAFAVFEARRRPLKIGIHDDIIAALGGAVTAAEIGVALRHYTGNIAYLDGLRTGAPRVGLDGNTAGEVTAAQAADATAMWIAAVARNKRKKAEIAKPAAAKPSRLGLADLKREALARKAEAKM